MRALDVPGTMARVCNALGQHEISISAALQHEANVGEFVPVVITTHEANEAAVGRAMEAIKALEVIEGHPVVIRMVDPPEG